MTRTARPSPGPVAGSGRAGSLPGAWHVYLLRCRDGSLYAGATNDLARRLEAHARGQGARYTRSRLPVALVFSERAADRSAALRREAAVKRLTRAEKLALVARVARGVGGRRPPERRRRRASAKPEACAPPRARSARGPSRPHSKARRP